MGFPEVEDDTVPDPGIGAPKRRRRESHGPQVSGNGVRNDMGAAAGHHHAFLAASSSPCSGISSVYVAAVITRFGIRPIHRIEVGSANYDPWISK